MNENNKPASPKAQQPNSPKASLYTLIAYSQDVPGIAYRITNLFIKRKINIDSLTVSHTEQKGISRFTITIHATAEAVEKIIKQLYKIIEVTKVFERQDHQLIAKEVALFRVSSRNPQSRRELEDLVHLFRARVIYVDRDSLTIEMTGREDQINSLLYLLRPFGIKELVRSGRIAIDKSAPDANLYQPKNYSELVSGIQVSAIKKMQLLASQTPGCVSLAQGIPSFATPDHIRQAAIQAINNGHADKYTPGWGIEPLRQAAAYKITKFNDIPAKPEQILITHGAIQALMATFIALMDPQDQVLVPTPDYASHITQLRIARHGGRPQFISLDETSDGWKLDPDKIRGTINAHTKAILICNPSNPTGKVYTREELQTIVDIANQYNLFIITDEMYEHFTYDGAKHISIATLPGAAERTISIFGVSKAYCMTGWRIGYLHASEEIVEQIFKVHDSLITCPTAVSQYAALAALTGPQDSVDKFAKDFKKRRDLVQQAINECPHLELAPCQGAYYAFCKIVPPTDDYELCLRLIKQAGVACVPGSAFGLGGESHLRISFCVPEDQLKEGLTRLTNYLSRTM